jgi:hypothetical protein
MEGIVVSKLKGSSLVVLVLAMTVGLSTVALAEHEESHDEDTLLSFAYDNLNHFLAVNLGPNDVAFTCDFEDGTLTAMFGTGDPNGVIAVDVLEGEDGVKTFDPRPEDELAEGVVAETEPAEYAGADGVCGVSGLIVAGPNGQINHGQLVKAAKGLLDMKGQGCVLRYFAQSDIGRTDETMIRTSDVDSSFAIGESGELDFLTFEADCDHGKKDKGEETQAANSGNGGNGGNRGKSADAPGHNK